MVKAKAMVEVKLAVEASEAHNSQLNLCQALCKFSRKSWHKPVTNKIITILFFSCSSIYNMYLPPGNIDELINAPDYVLPVLRGRQIAKLIGQGLISGDNFILIDKKNPSKPIKAKSTNDLICGIPADDPRYAGLHNKMLWDRKTGGLIDIYAKNSSWISAGNKILFLDIAKTRSYAQECGRITGKRIFKTLADQLDWKLDTSDFPTILKSVLDPVPPGKYKPPNSNK
jgi:hypothetical protein